MGYYSYDSCWLPAKLNGEHNDCVLGPYYSIIFNGCNDIDSVYADCLRAMAPSSFQAQPDGSCLGWMMKKSGVHGTETKRWFHLRAAVLQWYDNEEMEHPNGMVDLAEAQSVGPCSAPTATNLEIEILMKPGGRLRPPLRLLCTSRKDRQQWLRSLCKLL